MENKISLLEESIKYLFEEDFYKEGNSVLVITDIEPVICLLMIHKDMPTIDYDNYTNEYEWLPIECKLFVETISNDTEYHDSDTIGDAVLFNKGCKCELNNVRFVKTGDISYIEYDSAKAIE